MDWMWLLTFMSGWATGVVSAVLAISRESRRGERQALCDDGVHFYEEKPNHVLECARCGYSRKRPCIGGVPHDYRIRCWGPRQEPRLECTVCGDWRPDG